MVKQIIFRYDPPHFIYSVFEFVKYSSFSLISVGFSNVVYGIIFYLSDSLSSNAVFFAYGFKSHIITGLVESKPAHDYILGSVWQRTQKPFDDLSRIKRKREHFIS